MLARTFGCVRVVWNRTLADRRVAYAAEKRTVSYGEASAALTGWKDDPRVAPVLRRVTARRLAYLVEVVRAAGFSEPTARQRAQLAYAAYLGQLQLAHTLPGELVEARDYIDLFMAAVLGSPDGAAPQ